MLVKDYYKILQVEPNADLNTIKRAFRKLAMQYHPDKNDGNYSSTSYFRELQVAYEILSNPQKREEYHYHRWLEKSKGYALDTAIGEEQILQLFIHTERVIHETDSFRINNFHMIDMLLNVYTTTRLEIIVEKNDSRLEKNVIQLGRQSSKSLPSVFQLKMIEQLNTLLNKHPDQKSKWFEQVKVIQRKEFIEKLKLPVVIALTIILCLLILLISK